MYLNDLLYINHTPSQDRKEVVDLLDSEEDPAIAAQEEARVQALLDSLDDKVVCDWSISKFKAAGILQLSDWSINRTQR